MDSMLETAVRAYAFSQDPALPPMPYPVRQEIIRQCRMSEVQTQDHPYEQLSDHMLSKALVLTWSLEAVSRALGPIAITRKRVKL